MFGLLKDLTTIVTAPVKIAVDVAEAAVKPVAEVTKELVKDIEDSLK